MTSKINFLVLVVVTSAFTDVSAFQIQRTDVRHTRLSMGLFDDLNYMFSEEGREKRKALEEKQKADMEAAQREVFERRRSPEKMEAYMNEVQKKRAMLMEDKAVYDFQQKTEEGYDPLTDWKRLKAEGKVKVGDDLERDPTTSRLGSEGLQEVRVDERMPYIDQGYVDEDADVMGKLFGMFGGKKKSE